MGGRCGKPRRHYLSGVRCTTSCSQLGMYLRLRRYTRLRGSCLLGARVSLVEKTCRLMCEFSSQVRVF